jgi:acetoin utilization deacetylase AcuC-like enzyme
VGRSSGLGFTVNVPLEVGAVDDDYQLVFSRIVGPVLRQFEPDLIIVSAGFDAHERDPLGGMRLSTAAFGAMTQDLRIVSVTEGGYDLQALAASLDGVIEAHEAAAVAPAVWPKSGIQSSRGTTALADLRPILAPFWTL